MAVPRLSDRLRNHAATANNDLRLGDQEAFWLAAEEIDRLRAEVHALQDAVSEAEGLAFDNKARALRTEVERDDARAAADAVTVTHRIISEIRQAPGIGYRPMLSELPASVAALANRAEKAEAEAIALRAEVAQLRNRTGDRDYGC